MQCKLSVTLAAAAGVLGMVALSPLATAKDVNSNSIEPTFQVFEHDDFEGRELAVDSDLSSLSDVCWSGGGCGNVNDNISSMKNGFDRDVIMYSDANYSGVPYYAQPNSEDSDVTNNNFDNRASSIDIR